MGCRNSHMLPKCQWTISRWKASGHSQGLWLQGAQWAIEPGAGWRIWQTARGVHRAIQHGAESARESQSIHQALTKPHWLPTSTVNASGASDDQDFANKVHDCGVQRRRKTLKFTDSFRALMEGTIGSWHLGEEEWWAEHLRDCTCLNAALRRRIPGWTNSSSLSDSTPIPQGQQSWRRSKRIYCIALLGYT